MSQVEDVEAALRLPHVRCSQSRGSAALAHIANCPSNVRWRRLQTDGRLLDTLTEHSSLWSMSSLSSPFRTETACGFSPWGLVRPHCEMSCLALSSPIKKLRCRALQSDDVTMHILRWAGAASSCCFKEQTPYEVGSTHG